MRILKKIFKRKREMERIETLGKVFPYSRAEDMAKVFELGRIHALSQLRAELYKIFTIVALVITIGGYFLVQDYFIGKYLSGLCKLDSVIVLKAGFETQLRAPRLSIPFGMSALSMTRQIGDGCLQSGIEFRHVSMLQGPDNVA